MRNSVVQGGIGGFCFVRRPRMLEVSVSLKACSGKCASARRDCRVGVQAQGGPLGLGGLARRWGLVPQPHQRWVLTCGGRIQELGAVRNVLVLPKIRVIKKQSFHRSDDAIFLWVFRAVAKRCPGKGDAA